MRIAWILYACATVSAIQLVVGGVTTTSFLTPADRQRLKEVFLNALSSNDLSAVHYAVLGIGLLSEKVPKPQDTCKFISTSANGATTPEAMYHAADSWKALGCSGSPPANFAKELSAAIDQDGASMANLYFGTLGLASLGQKPKDVDKLVKSLQAAMKKDDALINLGYLFHVAASLGSAGNFAFDRIEDAVVQADEVDAKMLQFEGGLSITALIVSGAYKLAVATDKKPPMTGEQAVKFANYFMSRRSVQLPKGSYGLLDVLHILTNNKFHQPVAITLASQSAVSATSPGVNVRVSDLLGRGLGPLSVTADTATRLGDDVVELANAPLTPAIGDSSLYTLDLLKASPKRGFYRLAISVRPLKPDDRLVGHSGAPLQVKVLGAVVVEAAEIGTADADQTTAPKLSRVSYPSKSGTVVEADWHQRLLMRFVLKDQSTKEPMTVHQAFVKLTNQASGQEIIFIAEPDTSRTYRFDMDIGARAGDFAHLSGKYTLSLLVGDAVLSNSFSWEVTDVQLTFAGSATPPASLDQISDLYKPRPEIKHLFREPEKRPPATVSTLFTVLVCSPLFVLVVLWLMIGINISNFPISLTALGFHLGLGGIFGLFVVFWMQLNMFQTLNYLLAIGVVTFLCGNKMLAKLAANRSSR